MKMLTLNCMAGIAMASQDCVMTASGRECFGSGGREPPKLEAPFEKYEPYDPKYRNQKAKDAVTDVHVVFSNHLDIGFNVRAWCDGADGCKSPADSHGPSGDLPCRPWAYWVLNENIKTFIPRAIDVADEMRSDEKYVYMTQPWVASFYSFCNNTGVREWRNPAGGAGEQIVTCPNVTEIARFRTAVKQGSIFWHAFPHNPMPGLYDPSLFEASLQMGIDLADEIGVGHPTTYSQRDETGITRAILPLLNKHGVSMISLGSGGSSYGHPVVPSIFRWQDEVSGAEVVFAHDHGYGGGTHILPNGAALYCSWNTDNGGPHTASSVRGTLEKLRKQYTNANVRASTFDAFSKIADANKEGLPVVTQEIGDTWLYGVPSDPWKNVYEYFRKNYHSNRRAACIDRKQCDPKTLEMKNFDRLLTKIPEHTWGEDTTWYLADYNNWTNAQIMSAMQQDNYNMTVESWREQRSYLVNAVALMQGSDFGDEIAAAVDELKKLTAPPATDAFTRAADLHQVFTCSAGGKAVKVGFGQHGEIAALNVDGVDWAAKPTHARAGAGPLGRACAADHGTAKACCGQPQGPNPVAPVYQIGLHTNFKCNSAIRLDAQCPSNAPYCTNYVYDKHMGTCTDASPTPAPTPAPVIPGLGLFQYQTLDAADFTAFDGDYISDRCGPVTENPGCHNFNKPNMSSANPLHLEVAPTLDALWNDASSCHFIAQSSMRDQSSVQSYYGGPGRVYTEVVIGAGTSGVDMNVTVRWENKTTTRLAEASWVSFVPSVKDSEHGWRIRNFGNEVDPTDVVMHGATHLHSIGPDGGMRYTGSEGTMDIVSLDAPIVSCGLLSPFPTPGDNSSLTQNMKQGMHWNVENNIWNTNFPQWYPFEGVFGYGEQDASLGLNAAFRFALKFSR